MRTTPLALVGVAVVLLCGAEQASAIITANTIDEHATYTKHGKLLRVSRPIACTRGERNSIRVAIRQPATAARARSRWKGRCTGRSGSQNGGREKRVIAEDVCFTVNNIGDPIPSTVRATLFRSTKKPRSSSTALLLQHGAVSERSA